MIQALHRWSLPLLLVVLLVTLQLTTPASYACDGTDCSVVARVVQQATAYPPPATAVPPTAVPPTAVAPTAGPPAPTAVPSAYPPPATAVPPTAVAPTAVAPTAVAPTRPPAVLPTAAPTAIVPRPTPPPLPDTSGSSPGGATMPLGIALMAMGLAGAVMVARYRRRDRI